MENNKRSYLIPILVAFSMAIGLLVGSLLTPIHESALTEKEQARYQKMGDVIRILDKEYVDDVDSDALFEKTIADMLHQLDPHSNYISAKDLERVNEGIQGKFGGVGVRFFVIRDTVCITNVLPNSPSELAGLKAGDKIIKVDGELIAGTNINNDKVMDMLKGNAGKQVNLVISRQGKKMKKTVIRGSIPVESVIASYMINKRTGYIKVDRFSVTTSQEFRAAAFNLRSKGMKSLILDLRNNGGGVLSCATDIADEFFDANVQLLKTKGKNVGSETYTSTSRGSLKDVKLAVLINSNSASASEILAGAIQDNDRGTIFGRRSFGKGLVQKDVNLRDGSNLRVTIARYYTPSGRCIQKPYNGNIDDYYEDQMDRYDNGEMYEVDSSFFVDSLKFTTPKGKVVYGGGGIMPDVFVPIDSAGTSWYLTSLRMSPAFTTFAFDYVQNKRTKWDSPSQFDRTFTVTDAILERFVQFAKTEHEIKIARDDLKHSKDVIKKMIKGEIARQIWVEQGYYEVNNKNDNEVQEALNYLK
ncbi:MAG: carboxyl-terminal processing protease [Crocinitomicaceae bacterium]|jgi:carboxyl-terminal processing protease